MADDWYYARNNERRGPVPFAKLKAMANDGWLRREDLVWGAGSPDWRPAGEIQGLFGTALGQVLQGAIAGLKPSMEKMEKEANGAGCGARPPFIPEQRSEPVVRRTAPMRPAIDWDDLKPRHVLAACGGLLAALGIAFTAVAQSRVALAFTLSGLFIAAVSLSAEIGVLLGQAVENIGKASKEAAERRLRARELALEQRRLDLEAARLAQEQAAREAQASPAPMTAALPAEELQRGADLPGATGQVLVINEPPVQKWSPGLAAVLSFLLPGLGQLYKGQVLNGIVWFFLVGFGYAALILPGLLLHFFCVLGALSGNPWTEGRTTVVRQ